MACSFIPPLAGAVRLSSLSDQLRSDNIAADVERTRLSNSLRMLLESAGEGIYGIDADGRCTFMNTAAAGALGVDKSVLYQSLTTLGGGAILGGLILAAIGVFVIDRHFMKAAIFALVGAGLTFFGFIHGETLGFGESPLIAVSYLGVAGILLLLSAIWRSHSLFSPRTNGRPCSRKLSR